MSPNTQFIVMLGIAVAAGVGYLLPNGITLPKWPAKQPATKTPDWFRAEIERHEQAITEHAAAIDALKSQANAEASVAMVIAQALTAIVEGTE